VRQKKRFLGSGVHQLLACSIGDADEDIADVIAGLQNEHEFYDTCDMPFSTRTIALSAVFTCTAGAAEHGSIAAKP